MRRGTAETAGPSRTPAQRARGYAACKRFGHLAETLDLGGFTPPNSSEIKGSPRNAKHFVGVEANACVFQKGDRGMIVL